MTGRDVLSHVLIVGLLCTVLLSNESLLALGLLYTVGLAAWVCTPPDDGGGDQ